VSARWAGLRGTLYDAPTVLAAITFTQILEILALIAVVHVVLLAPFMLAGFLSWLEYHENAKTRRLRRR
jgi:hypothetical protein